MSATRSVIPLPPPRRTARQQGVPARFRRDDKGAVAVTFAVAVPALIGVAALAIDVVDWQSTRLAMQESADQATLAGGIAAQVGADVANEARGLAAANGFVHGAGGVSVTVNNPPLTGSNAGDVRAVEVIIAKAGTSTFSQAFRAPPSLTARAVALPKADYSGGMCAMALATDGAGIAVGGSGIIDAPNCNIYSNSTAANSVDMSGSAMLRGYDIRVAGDVKKGSNNTLTGVHSLQTRVAATADPYAGRTIPAFSGCNATSASLGSGAVVTAGAAPYVFCNGLNIGGSVTFNPGIYVIDRGTLNISSSAAVQATGGVTFILTSSTGTGYATMNMAGSASLSIRAPATGPTAGLAVWVDRRAGGSISNAGSSTWNMTGVFYAPTTTLGWNGGGGAICAQIVAYRISFGGSSSMQNRCAGVGVANPPGSVVPAAMALKE